jgi:hypothetical protein
MLAVANTSKEMNQLVQDYVAPVLPYVLALEECTGQDRRITIPYCLERGQTLKKAFLKVNPREIIEFLVAQCRARPEYSERQFDSARREELAKQLNALLTHPVITMTVQWNGGAQWHGEIPSGGLPIDRVQGSAVPLENKVSCTFISPTTSLTVKLSLLFSPELVRLVIDGDSASFNHSLTWDSEDAEKIKLLFSDWQQKYDLLLNFLQRITNLIKEQRPDQAALSQDLLDGLTLLSQDPFDSTLRSVMTKAEDGSWRLIYHTRHKGEDTHEWYRYTIEKDEHNKMYLATIEILNPSEDQSFSIPRERSTLEVDRLFNELLLDLSRFSSSRLPEVATLPPETT